jgi:hypothetical protein
MQFKAITWPSLPLFILQKKVSITGHVLRKTLEKYEAKKPDY